MKKRKFGFLLNIALLCLCLAAIAVGVYSVKTAQLTVTGTIGFTAHNTKMGLTGSILACESSNATTRKEATIASTSIETSEVKLDLNKAFSGSSDGKMYFSDLFDEGKIIVITLTLTNNSDYPVKATVNMPTFTGSNYTKEVKLGTEVITSTTTKNIAKSGTLTMTITLTLTDENVDITTAGISGTLFNFEPKIAVEKTATITWGESQCTIYFEEGMTWREWVEGEYWKKSSELRAVTISENEDPQEGQTPPEDYGSIYVTIDDTQMGTLESLDTVRTGAVIQAGSSYQINL